MLAQSHRVVLGRAAGQAYRKGVILALPRSSVNRPVGVASSSRVLSLNGSQQWPVNTMASGSYRCRHYATAGTTSETRATVVKKRATAEKASTAGKPKSSGSKGAASPRKGKSARAKRKTATKTKAKAATKPKRKSAAAKSKPKKVVKKTPAKELTDEEKTAKKIRELKKLALKSPSGPPTTAWTMVVAEVMNKNIGGAAARGGMKNASEKYKTLSPAEQEHYNHVAATNIKARKQAHREWIESHGVDEIRQANNARKMLRRLVPSKFSRLRLLKDDRLPKRPLPVYVSFVRDRWASGDLKHMTIKDVAKLMSTEWKELSASEREKYEEDHRATFNRYEQEYKFTFGRDPPTVLRKARKTRGRSTSSSSSSSSSSPSTSSSGSVEAQAAQAAATAAAGA